MPYAIDAQMLVKRFGDHVALDAVDLAVPRGTVTALLGPNGAGKTTIVRILATLIRPDAGHAAVAGHDLLSQPALVRRDIALTGQFAAVDLMLTGRENLQMVARLLRLPRRAARIRADELLEQFDLADAGRRRAHTYSGGMRRRLDLAMSMVRAPQLLFLDEPTTGLDPRSRDQVWSVVRRMVDGGLTVLLTTQYLEEADRLADAVAVLDHGRVVARGTPDELKAGVGGERLALQFADADGFGRAAMTLRAARSDPRTLTLEVATDGSAVAIQQTLAQLDAECATPARLSVHRPTLDDVFLSLTETAAPGRHQTKELTC